MQSAAIQRWLPAGKTAAVCLALDDVHPATSRDAYEAGGDLERGVLGHLLWLLERHPRLKATLFVTPAWRMISGHPTRLLRSRLPWLRERLHLTPVRPRHALRLDRHPRFCRFLRALPRTELALHGLHHVRRGDPLHVEFLGRSRRACRRALERGIEIFRRADLPLAPGFAPPGWHLTAELAEAAAEAALEFVASARDLETPIAPAATTAGCGLRGAPLCVPARLAPSGLIHFTTNYQATSAPARAFAILDAGGLLAIKAHAAKRVVDHVMADGLDAAYRDSLHRLFARLEDRYGDDVAWTSFGALAAGLRREPA